jgi:hypothetical protein
MRFPRWKQLMEEHIPPMLQKTMDTYVLPTISICIIISDTFDLWMNQSDFNNFSLVVISLMMHGFLNTLLVFWNPLHYLCYFGKDCKIITTPIQIWHVENESLNLNTLVFAHSIVFSFESLQLDVPFIGTCSHVQSLSIFYQWY